ncbi:MAG: RNA polymerase sigma factor [Pseudonocardiaceae bacterium]
MTSRQMSTATVCHAPADAPEDVACSLERIRQGDAAAWDEILRRYGKLVMTTVWSFRLQEADALDAVQMTWLRLAENIHRIQFPERLGGWLVTTARHECLHILRQVKPVPGLVDEILDTVADPSVDPEQHVINADTAQALGKLISELTPRRRDLVQMMLFTDAPRSYAEVSQATGIPLGGIGTTRARALRQLRERLSRQELGADQDTA